MTCSCPPSQNKPKDSTLAASYANTACQCKDVAVLAQASAEASQLSAATSASQAEAALDDFQTRYLGAFASAPVTTSVGALYFNTSSNSMFVWNGTTWIIAIGGWVPSSIQVFTSSGTWAKPFGAVSINVQIMGGGGGGGGGARYIATTSCSGGGGGGGGGVFETNFSAIELPSTVAVTVGAGGIGGAGAINNGDGSAGLNGGTCNFGIYAYASGGDGGLAGTNVGNAFGGAGGSYSGNSGGSSQFSGGGSTEGGGSLRGGSGGGAGGAIFSGSPQLATRGGSNLGANLLGGNRGNSGAIPGNGFQGGLLVGVNSLFNGSGGGGGGGGNFQNGGNGGNGRGFGTGGGGGGAVNYPSGSGTAGTGGNGSPGVVIVTTYF